MRNKQKFRRAFAIILCVSLLSLSTPARAGWVLDTYQIIIDLYKKFFGTEKPVTPPNQRILGGYLVVLGESRIEEIKDLKRNDKICGTKSAIEYLRAFPPLSGYNFQTAKVSEIYQSMTYGICNAVFVVKREDADKLFPTTVTYMRLIPVYQE